MRSARRFPLAYSIVSGSIIGDISCIGNIIKKKIEEKQKKQNRATINRKKTGKEQDLYLLFKNRLKHEHPLVFQYLHGSQKS